MSRNGRVLSRHPTAASNIAGYLLHMLAGCLLPLLHCYCRLEKSYCGVDLDIFRSLWHQYNTNRTLVPRHENGDAHLDDEVTLEQTWKAVSECRQLHYPHELWLLYNLEIEYPGFEIWLMMMRGGEKNGTASPLSKTAQLVILMLHFATCMTQVNFLSWFWHFLDGGNL